MFKLISYQLVLLTRRLSTDFFCIYQKNSYAEFLKFNDIIISGYGSLNVDNENVKKLTFDLNLKIKPTIFIKKRAI